MSITTPTLQQSQSDLPLTQKGHNRCALFTFPQAEHLFRAVTSFSPFPAKNLWRFFLWEVFFFGTARRIDPHSPASIDGTSSPVNTGTVMEVCKSGCRIWERRGTVLARKGYEVAVVEDARGRYNGKKSWRRAILGFA